MIQFQHNGSTVNVFDDDEHLLYFTKDYYPNPLIRLLRSDTDFVGLLQVIDLINKYITGQPCDVKWK
jgi:hypothetical protein